MSLKNPIVLFIIYIISFKLIIISLLVMILIVCAKIIHNNSSSNIFSWKHPMMFLCMTVGILYPLIWGLYYSLLKYLRMSTVIPLNIEQIFFTAKMAEILLIILIFSQYLIFVIIYIISFFNKIRQYLWDVFSLLCYFLHIALLKYNLYFNVMKKLYYLNFFCYNLVCLNAPVNRIYDYYSYSKLARFINTLYYYPFIFLIPLFIGLIMEIIIAKRIYYTSYLLFWVPMILGIFKLFNIFGSSSFTKDVCLTDYINKNLAKLRAPVAFWEFLENPEYFFGFSINVLDNEYAEWNKHYLIHKEKIAKKHSKEYYYRLFLRVSGTLETNNLTLVTSTIYGKKKYCLRVKTAYLYKGYLS